MRRTMSYKSLLSTRSLLHACAVGMLLTGGVLVLMFRNERGHAADSGKDPSFVRFEHEIIPLLQRRCSTR